MAMTQTAVRPPGRCRGALEARGRIARIARLIEIERCFGRHELGLLYR